MFRPVKRENQSLRLDEIEAVLEKNHWGVLSLYGVEGYPYGVPINYAYVDGVIVFHSAREGHKSEAMAGNDKVAFTVVDRDEIVEEAYTTAYRSVIAFGRVKKLEGKEKIEAFIQMTNELTPSVSEKSNEETVKNCTHADVYGIAVDHLSGKVGRLTPRD
ncbi:MAG: pyridoxamine 5'-phosphate oxidase family protein [Peptoniphilus sp.]|nr:pyridoxamine 5'-phosphate oxidase family protein [Peptoniphilus sp.]MDY3119066.1 pyridoxamine 5'-phosphate oxidase family protein [Peptoniphilus sp.]